MQSNTSHSDIDKKFPGQFTGPGLVDVQINGYAGVNFNAAAGDISAADYRKAMIAMKRRGVVMALPTFITDDFDAILARCENYAKIIAADDELAAFYPKLHIEGPFISPEQGPRGAHRAEFIIPASSRPDAVDELMAASGGRIGIITFAPENDGAVELVKKGVAAGIVMSLGHGNPSNQDVDAAVAAGAKMCTHLGNGSHQTLPRLDNYLQKQLACDELIPSFIADGHHIPFFTLKNFIRSKGVANCVLVTDAISAAELGQGVFELSDTDSVEVTASGKCQIAGQDNLAGSAITHDRSVINTARHCDVSFEDAWAMASTIPAKLLSLGQLPEVTVKLTDDDHFELVK